MAWNSPGGNGGGRNDGPWGGGQSPWGRGSGGGNVPPDFDKIWRRGRDRFRRAMPGGWDSGRGVVLLILAALVLWGLTGFYKVNPEEIGVVLRFGEASAGTTEPGLRYHLPAPIETAQTPAVTRINRIELGYSSTGNGRAFSSPSSNESLMLTGDENIVDINFSVFWQIKDPEQYLFDIRDPEGTVRVVAESAIREIIGQLPIRAPLSENRQPIVDRTKQRMQELLDQYRSGITVVQVQLLKADPPADVIDAFNDVQRAKADQERLSNEADAYRNDIIPRARGDAQRIIQESQAYKEQVIAQSQGDSQRFLSVLNAYKVGPDVTAQRLYLETMEDVLKNSQKVIIDPEAKGLVPYLPLPELGKTPPNRPATPSPSSSPPPAPAPSSVSAPATGGTR